MSGLSSGARQWIGLGILLTTGAGWLVWWAVCSAYPTTVPPPPPTPTGGFFTFLGGLSLVLLAVLVLASIF